MQHSEYWTCSITWCSAEHWRVQAVPDLHETWEIASEDGGTWTLAAEQPICPLCGSDLHEIMTGLIVDKAFALHEFSSV